MNEKDQWPQFGREEITVSQREPDALSIAKRLGFQKVKYVCDYEGPVEQLVAELKANGWYHPEHENKFLLVHDQTGMVWNYALDSKTPSKRFASYFWSPNI